MESLSVPRLIITGLRAGVGKSIFGIGLTHELRRRGIGVSCAVSGTNLLQASIYRRISGRVVRTLDANVLSEQQLQQGAFFAGVGADVLLVHGDVSMHASAHAAGGAAGDAELARLLAMPLALVLDARDFVANSAAIGEQVVSELSGLQLAALVYNHVDAEIVSQLQQCTDFYERLPFVGGELPLIGQLPRLNFATEMPSRVPSQRANTIGMPISFFLEAGQSAGRGLDIDRLLGMAAHVPALAVPALKHQPLARRVRIAVSDDVCFSLCFQDNLDLMRYYGAELVSFSPLADARLPERIGAVYLTGGFLSEYGPEVSANASMLNALRDFAHSGGVIYAEGAGSAYLCRRFKVKGRGKSEWLPGAGVIAASATEVAHQFSYREAVIVDDCILGQAETLIKGISTGEWKIADESNTPKVFRAAARGAALEQDGFSPSAQAVCSLTLNNMASQPHVAQSLVEAAMVVRRI